MSWRSLASLGMTLVAVCGAQLAAQRDRALRQAKRDSVLALIQRVRVEFGRGGEQATLAAPWKRSSPAASAGLFR